MVCRIVRLSLENYKNVEKKSDPIYIISKHHHNKKINRLNSISYANSKPTNRVFKNFLFEASLPQWSHSYRSLSLFTIRIHIYFRLIVEDNSWTKLDYEIYSVIQITWFCNIDQKSIRCTNALLLHIFLYILV